MPLQNFYLDTDSLRVGNNQLYLQSNAVYVGNNLWVGNTIVLGYNGSSGFGGTYADQPYGAQNKIVLSANTPSPAPFAGAIDMRVNAAGGRVGITFDSYTNLGSDFGYIYYYDDLAAYAASGTQERGTLLIGVQNDYVGTSEDVVAIESPGNIFINPGMGTDARVGSSSFNNLYGNLYVGNAATKYLVLHEGVTGVTTLRTNVNFQTGNIQMSNTTTSNWIGWSTAGVAAPAITTRSAGTKLVLYPGVSSTSVDYGIGVETNHLWFSTSASTTGFKWYANTTQIMISNTTGLTVNGALNAVTKSFVIDHPTKPGKTLRYGSLEGPENGVYVRGRLTGTDTIDLPDYWSALVDAGSITVNLTPIGTHQKLYIKEANTSSIVVVGTDNLFSKNIDCFYTVFAERKDVPKLVVEE